MAGVQVLGRRETHVAEDRDAGISSSPGDTPSGLWVAEVSGDGEIEPPRREGVGVSCGDSSCPGWWQELGAEEEHSAQSSNEAGWCMGG